MESKTHYRISKIGVLTENRENGPTRAKKAVFRGKLANRPGCGVSRALNVFKMESGWLARPKSLKFGDGGPEPL